MSKSSGSISNKSILLSMTSVMTKIITLVSTMIVVRMLDPTDYATYKQTFLAFNFVLPFLSFGLTTGLYYFLPSEKDRLRGRINDCYVVYGITGVLFALFIICGGNALLASRYSNPDVESLMLWMIPYALIVLLTQCVPVVFNVFNRIKLYMIYYTICGAVTSGSLVCAILIFGTARSAVISVTAAKVAEGLVALYLVSRVVPNDNPKPTAKSIKEILLFSIPLGINSAIGTITKQTDNLFISLMMTPEAYAYYSVGAHEMSLLTICVSSVNSACIPAMRKHISNGEYEKCSKLYLVSARRLASILVPVLCFFWIWSPEFISTIYSERYLRSMWVFRIYLIFFLQRVSASAPVFTALGMNNYLLMRTIAQFVLNCVLNFVFISLFGMIGAAIATIASGMLIMLVSNLPMISKKLNIPYHKTYPFLLVLFSTGVGMALGYLVRYLICDTFVSGLVSLIGLSDRFGLSTSFDSMLFLGLSGIIFLFVYGIFAFVFLRKDYKWIFDKSKEIFSKIFRRRKKAPASSGATNE